MSDARTIHLLGKPFEIPSPPKALASLRDEVKWRAGIVESGSLPQEPVRLVSLKRGMLGLGEPKPVVEILETEGFPLDEAERLEQLQALLSCYDGVVDTLEQSRGAYLAFFKTLAEGVRQASESSLARIARAESERRALSSNARALNDAGLLLRAEQVGERLRRSARALAQATLLIVRKLEIYEEGLATLARDQTLQRQVLERFRARLALHQRMVSLEAEIDALEAEIGGMAQLALGFGDYMRDYLGPLQGLLEEVSGVDARLCEAAFEIEALADDLTRERDLAMPEPEVRLIDFLVTARLKRDRLEEILALSGPAASFDEVDLAIVTDAPSLEHVLDNIEGMVKLKLAPILGLELPSTARASNHAPTPRDTLRPRRLLAPLEDSGLLTDNLSRVRLAGMDLRRAYLQGADLTSADLTGADLTGANLIQADLTGAIIDKARLQGAWLQGAKLGFGSARGAVLFCARFDAATVWPQGFDPGSHGAFGPGVTLRDLNLQGMALQGVDLQRADLQRTSFHKADLRGARLCSADLRGADFSKADLRGADLRGAIVFEVVEAGKWRIGLDMHGALYDRTTRWPERFRPRAAGATPAPSG